MSQDASSNLLLVDLPRDVLEIIFGLVDRKDIKKLSLVCRHFHQKVAYYLFQKLHGSWHQVLLLGSTQSYQWFKYVRQICIFSADSRYEYQTDALRVAADASRFPHLDRVEVNSNSLSFWLKNHACENVFHLRLYLEASQQGNEKLFHLAHVDSFRNLKTLHLHNYSFRWGQDVEDIPIAALEVLSLDNCTWEYPFNLARFNLHDSLRSLSTIYSNDNTFVLLERYVDYLRNPFHDHLSSLRFVSLSFVDCSVYKSLLSPMVLFNLLECFTGLRQLHLSGWATNLDSLRRVLLSRSYEDSFVLRLEVDDYDEKIVSAFLCLVQRPNLELTVKPTSKRSLL